MLKVCLPFRIWDVNVSQSLALGKLPRMDWTGISDSMQDFILQSLAIRPEDRPPFMELLQHPALVGAIVMKSTDVWRMDSDAQRFATKLSSTRNLHWREPRTGQEAFAALTKAKFARTRLSQSQSHRLSAARFHSAFGSPTLVWDSEDFSNSAIAV